MRSRTVVKRGSAARSGRASAAQNASNSLSLFAPTVNQPSLARSAWYGAARRCAEPSGFGALPVTQYSVDSHTVSAMAASSSEVSTSWPRPVRSRYSSAQRMP